MNDSKEYIVTIASRLFLQKSYKEVTMKELVEKTGLSKGAFYHYFESKEQLFLAVLDYFFTNVMRRGYEKYSRDSFYRFYHDYAREIKEYSDKYIQKFKGEESESEFNLNYFTLAFDALKLFPDFKERMIAEQHKEFQIWEEVLRNARQKGEIKSVLTDNEIARIFIYISDGAAMHKIMEGVRIVDMIQPFLVLWDKLYETIKA